MKVDFFIVGAPKAGTTSLYHYLNEHPKISMSSVKEPNYFSHEELENQKLYYKSNKINSLDNYHNLFLTREANLIYGEASVSYLFYKNVPEKIKTYNKNAKIIILLRNPIERAFSHYLMDARLGLISESFESVVDSFETTDKNKLFYQQYIELGKYYNQISNYKRLFNDKNILIIDYEDFKNKTSLYVSNVFDFLQIDTSFKPNLDLTHNTFRKPKFTFIEKLYSNHSIRCLINQLIPSKFKNYINQMVYDKKDKPILSQDLRERLKSIFKNDVNKLSNMLNKDFSKWIR